MPAPARQTTLDGFVGRLAAVGSREITRHVAVAVDQTTLVARDRMRAATRKTLGQRITGPGGLSGTRTPPDYTVNAIRATQANWRSIREGDPVVGDVHVAAQQGSHNNDQSAYLKFQFGQGDQTRFPGDVGLAGSRVLVWRILEVLLPPKSGSTRTRARGSRAGSWARSRPWRSRSTRSGPVPTSCAASSMARSDPDPIR